MREVATYIDLVKQINELTAKKEAIGKAIKDQGVGVYLGDESEQHLEVTTRKVGRLDQKAVREALSEEFIKDRSYEEIVQSSQKYNDDLDNDYYISLVTNYASEPTHTTGFLDPRYTMGFLSS